MNITPETPKICTPKFTLDYVPNAQEIKDEQDETKKLYTARQAMSAAITAGVVIAIGLLLETPPKLSLGIIIPFAFMVNFIYSRVGAKRRKQLEADKIALTFINPAIKNIQVKGGDATVPSSIIYIAAQHVKTQDYVANVKNQNRPFTYGEIWLFQSYVGGKFAK